MLKGRLARRRFWKLKQMHNNCSSSSNLRWIKIFGFFGQKITNTWAFYKLNDSFAMDDSSKSQQMHYVFYRNVKPKDYVENNMHNHQGLVMYNKKNCTITMNKHFLMNILMSWTWTMPKDLLLLPLYQLMPNGLPKSGKALQPIPLLVSFALESLTRNLTLLKKNLWRIYVFISPKGTTHWSPIKRWKHGKIYRKNSLKRQ